ncbi:MAG: glycosyltransferase [Acidipila sp.]|nr:glycosyltransferase [Acidipila sp.]
MKQNATTEESLAAYRAKIRRRREQLIFTRIVIFASIAVSLPYFYWRATQTQNHAAMWFFYIFLAAEMLNFLESLLLYVTTWKPTWHESPPPPPAGRTVDVLIPTLDEPLQLLRETLICALGILYPHKTWLLDDGNRPGARELAEELGCEYLGRPEHVNAKAGNLNYALAKSSAEFVVVLDADHVPSPELIDELLGFFNDPQVGIVQATQDFYNLDSFQHQTNWRAKYAWQQQELFFSIIQPGKDGYNAAFYCGSPAILRRKALDDIGGFAVESITEDMHTSLRMQKKGWRVLYQNRTVARGLAPQTFPGFATQWKRWGHGAMQVLRLENPLFGSGLKLGQRLCYFASFYFYWMSYQKLIYVVTPIFCLLTGIFPLVADPARYLLFFTPYLVLNIAASAMLTGGLRGFLMSEEFNMMKMPVLMTTLRGLSRREREFTVTQKSQAEAAHFAQLWPLVAIEIGLAIGITAGCVRLARPTTTFEFWALVVNLSWASFYLLLLGPLVAKALKRHEQRCSYRFPGNLEVPMRFEYQTAKGIPVRDRAYVRNLNRTGLSVTLASPLPMGTRLEMELSLASQPIRATGYVMRHQEIPVNGHLRYSNGVRFDQISSADADTISKYLFWYVAPRHGDLLRLTTSSQLEERAR